MPEYPIVTIGAIQAGIKITPVNPIFTPGINTRMCCK